MSEPTRRTCLVRRGADVERLPEASHDRIDELLRDDDTLVWLDLRDPGPDELALLQREFGVHPLAIEDLSKRGQRAKLDTYHQQHVVVAYEALEPDGNAEGDGLPVLAEMHLFTGDRYVVTAHWSDSPSIDETMSRFERRADSVGVSSGGLLYSLLDAVVDGYFPVIDQLNDRVDSLEPELLSGKTTPVVLQRLLNLKRSMLELRRVITPLRDVANELLRREVPIIDDEAVPYYNDLYDHLVRVIESLDLLRDLVAATLDANLAATNNNLSAVMKRLTAFTVILMVPTLIAGIYGMNFRAMPELQWALGYPFALVLMAAAVIGAIVFFRREGWF